MANLRADGELAGDDPGTDDDLRGITCLDDDTAFVVGDGGLLLRTFDGGARWEALDLGTTAALHHVDVAWPGSVFVAADDGLYASYDLGDTWELLSAAPGWTSVAAADDGSAALALDADGVVWGVDLELGSALAPVTTAPGARALHLSHDGSVAALAGADGAILRSLDGGGSWASFDAGTDLFGVWAADDGLVTAVGAGGAMVRLTGDQLTTTAPGAATLRTLYLEDVYGYAAGDDGEILHTEDGGDTWAAVDVELTGTIYAIEDLDGGEERY